MKLLLGLIGIALIVFAVAVIAIDDNDLCLVAQDKEQALKYWFENPVECVKLGHTTYYKPRLEDPVAQKAALEEINPFW